MLVVGGSRAEYMARIRGVDRERSLVVAVDVGKRSAMALIANHCHEVVVAPFTFELTESGVSELLAKADACAEVVNAGSVRFGIEAAGHYHRGLVTRLDVGGRDVVELSPAIVKDARGRIGHRRVKTDVQDCLAMAEVLIDGLGHTPTERSVAMAAQAAWAGQRRRKVAARSVLARQIHAQVDLAFPHLTDCYSHGLDQRSLRVIMANICDPARVARLGPKRLRTYVTNRGVAMGAAKADQVVEAARQALGVPTVSAVLRRHSWPEIWLYSQLSRLRSPNVTANSLRCCRRRRPGFWSRSRVSRSLPLPTTGPRLGILRGSATPMLRIGTRVCRPPAMSPLARSHHDRGSAGKARSRCAIRSSRSVAVSPTTNPTSLRTTSGSSHQAKHRWSRLSRSDTAPIGSRLRCVEPRASMTPAFGPQRRKGPGRQGRKSDLKRRTRPRNSTIGRTPSPINKSRRRDPRQCSGTWWRTGHGPTSWTLGATATFVAGQHVA